MSSFCIVCVKVFNELSVKNEDINKMWLVFSAHDREGIGLITRRDFFEKIVEEPRTFFGDSILDFIGMYIHFVWV